MFTTKTSIVLIGLVACVAIAEAAGGIKGQRADDSQQRISGIKGPRAQQQLPPPPPPAPIPQYQPPPPPPARPAAPIKGAGQVSPVFTAARVQPVIVQEPQQVQQVIQQQEQEPEPQQLQQQVVQQQVQQQEEIDPNSAAQDAAPAIALPAAAAGPAASEEEANPRPEPYAFNYAFDAGDSATSGSSQREEQQDASGKVTGFYTLKGEDGRDRRVDYVADANGFRATISTNEMGTAPKNSADVDWQAQSPSDAQLRVAESATQAARQRALLQPQQPLGSASVAGKPSSPRANASKGQLAQSSANIAQLQEPFEQIRQTELNARARKSRHAPFYLFTV